MPATIPATFGVYHDRAALERAVTKFKEVGFSDSEISVFVPHDGNDLPAVPTGAKVGAGAGAVVGSVLGALVGAGLLAIPGIGALVIAGPLGTAIAGTAAFAGVGGIVGSFLGLGLSDETARRYESKLKQGQPILFVQIDNRARSEQAQQILADTGAEDIFSPEFNSFSKTP